VDFDGLSTVNDLTGGISVMSAAGQTSSLTLDNGDFNTTEAWTIGGNGSSSLTLNSFSGGCSKPGAPG